jgi:hypothetical protein
MDQLQTLINSHTDKHTHTHNLIHTDTYTTCTHLCCCTVGICAMASLGTLSRNTGELAWSILWLKGGVDGLVRSEEALTGVVRST